MKLIIIFYLLLSCFGLTQANEPDINTHPDAVFYRALAKIEHDYINEMRTLMERATEVILFQIIPTRIEVGPFDDYSEKDFFVLSELHRMIAYRIHRRVSIKDNDHMKEWAHAVLPPEDHSMTISRQFPEFGIRFIDTEGTTIYHTTFTLKGSYSSIEFPRYSDRIGINVNVIKKLLKDRGFDTQ